MVDYCLRQILMDRQSLDDYEKNRQVDWSDIQRRLLINERVINPDIPDHLYRPACNVVLSDCGINSLPALLTHGVRKLALIYLTESNGKVFIQENKFGDWQDLLTFCSPLLLYAAYLHGNAPFNDNYEDYLNRHLSPNVRHTVLFSPNIESLQMLKHRHGGFNDLHIHLNGATETDIVWQDALDIPNKFRQNYKNSLKNSFLVKEQNEQENIFRNADELYDLLNKARALRYYLVTFLKAGETDIYPNIRADIDRYNSYIIRGQHPLRRILGAEFCDEYVKDKLSYTNLEYECLMYIMIMGLLSNSDKSQEHYLVAKAFHHYLLILGTMNRFLVQQIHQNGFQQFQKIADNDLRKFSEKDYKKRFFQLCGNDRLNPNFKILEGRFAPKSTPREINDLIEKIRLGWGYFKTIDKNSMELRLISHFIKKTESIHDTYYHETLRNKLRVHSDALLSLWQDDEWCKCPISENTGESTDKELLLQKLVGIDAAASEFDTLPEVFAPYYRKIRRSVARCNFTFHVGEDFTHPISGLKAIYEAISFLELGEKDRIGHATALGLNYKLWQDRIGNKIWIKRGEYLDNLIFIYHSLNGSGDIPRDIVSEIENNYSIVYPGKPFDLHNIVIAWLNRKFDPALLKHNSIATASLEQSFDINEWQAIERAGISSDARNIIIDYLTNRDIYNTYILVSLNNLSDNVVYSLQHYIAEKIKEKKIIVETLPTSNLRISIYKRCSEHHIGRWLNAHMDIVVGSDDTGIFATNIYNEYAHILLNNSYDLSKLEKLAQSADKYVFSE